MKNIDKLTVNAATGEIEQGNISIVSTGGDYSMVHLNVHETGVLDNDHTAVHVKIHTSDMDVTVHLNSKQLDALEGAVHQAQKFLQEQNK